jgi:hypothetical protein
VTAPESGGTVEFIQGSAEDIIIPLFDDAGNPIPALDGWAAKVQVRHAPFPESPVLVEWVSGGPNDIVLADSTARLIVDADLAEASLAWSWRLAVWDLRMIAPVGLGSRPNRPQRGIIRVVPAVTR